MDQTPGQTGGEALKTSSETTASPQSTSGGTTGTADNTTLMGILAYLGPLVIIPFLVAKNNGFVKFHIKQGLVLLVISVALWLIDEVMYFDSLLYSLLNLLNLGLLVLAIIGIVNVIQKKEEKLPLVGQFGDHFKV